MYSGDYFWRSVFLLKNKTSLSFWQNLHIMRIILTCWRRVTRVTGTAPWWAGEERSGWKGKLELESQKFKWLLWLFNYNHRQARIQYFEWGGALRNLLRKFYLAPSTNSWRLTPKLVNRWVANFSFQPIKITKPYTNDEEFFNLRVNSMKLGR